METKKPRTNIFFFRLAIWGGLFSFVFWLAYMSAVPGGRIVYSYDFKGNSYHISKINPKERVEYSDHDGASLPVIIGDPAYFNLRAPRNFDRAVMRLKYKRTKNSNFPLIEAGLLFDGSLWRYDLKPVENKILDQLALAWEKTEENGLMLFKRIGASSTFEYENIGDFFENPPARDKIAVYNTDLSLDYQIDDYMPAEKKIKQEISLRGNYEFYTYIEEKENISENLSFKFIFYDLNQNKDPDPIDLHLYYENSLISSKRLEDDGIADDTGEKSRERELEFDLAGLPGGVYKIELRANNDIITKSIETAQKKLSFINRIWLFGGSEASSIFTDSKDIKLSTVEPSSLQTVNFGEKNISINETYKQYNIKTEKSLTEIGLEKANIILAGGGVFSFDSGSMLNPKLKRADSSLDINKEGIDFVLADYRIPSVIGEWREAVLEFDLSGAFRDGGKYGFIISIPGLRAEDNNSKEGIMIKEIEFELTGKTLWEKLFD